MDENNKLLDTLLSDKVISDDQYSLVKLEAINTGKQFEEVLLERGFATVEQMVLAKSKAYGIPFISLVGKGLPADVLSYVPEQLAKKYVVLPFEFDKGSGTLSVAMKNPLDLETVDLIEKKSGVKVKSFFAVPSELIEEIEVQYGQSLSSDVTAALKEASPTPSGDLTSEEKSLGEVIREAPVAKIVATLLEYAIRARASDVHIEPQEDRTRVRYRIDGILHEKLVLPKKVHDAVVSRIKILTDMKIDERRLPQDGRFNFKFGDSEVDLRVSSLPTAHGEKIVMRLLKKSGGVPSLPELGLRGTALSNLETNILRPHGIILITGPTGSGKTTTLYSILSKLNTTRVNIVTLEDPVEYQIPGVNQVQVNPLAGLTFASGLRSFLRQDPNIIMVGEIRDSETTDLAIQASLTGHLVFSTLHTNSASGALPRLLDMGAEPFLVSSSLNAVMAQRVVRRICNSCKVSYLPPPEIVNDIKSVLGKLFTKNENEEVKLYKGKGCDECNNTGYLGRIGIFEVLPVTEKIGRLILERASSADIERQALDDGMIAMKQDGYLKSLEGVTTIEEVLRVAQD